MLSGRFGGILAAGLVAGVLGLYAALMAALFAFGVGVTMSLPWWVALAGPALVYALLVGASLPGATAVQRAAAFGVLCAAYVLVGALTGILVAAVAGLPFATALDAASLSFLPAPLLQILAVPLALLPLRSLVVPGSRPRPARRQEAEFEWSRPRPETVPGWEAGRLASSVGVAPARSGSFPAPRPPAPSRADPAPAAAQRASALGGGAMPVSESRAAVEAPPAHVPVAAPQPLLSRVEPRPEAPAEDTVGIPFERIAGALPADLFACALDEVPARLARPGQLLVPVRLVLPQLADGLVAVAWTEVMGQFPAQAFKGSASAVAERLPEGRLVLPLDEVVRRLPPEIFAMPTPGIDLGAIESFPLPFQPVTAAPPLPATVRAARPEAPAVEEPAVMDPPALAQPAVATAETAVPEPVAETSVAKLAVPAAPVVASPEPSGPGVPVVALEAADAIEPAQAMQADAPVPSVPEAPRVAMGAADAVEPAQAMQADAPEASVPEAPGVAVEAADAVEPAQAMHAHAPEASVPEAPGVALEAADAVEPAQAMHADAPEPFVPEAPGVTTEAADAFSGEARLARLANLLAPVGALAGSVAERDGSDVYLFRPPTVPVEAMLQAVGPACVLLRGDASPAEQLTVRFERGAVVLTPLSDPAGESVLAVGAAPLDGSLALLEILSLRARMSQPATPTVTGGAMGQTLEPVPGGPAADLLAGAFGAFGAFQPSVVRDPAGRVELCLLLPAGEEPRTLGAHAHAACCALGATDGAALGPVQSAVLRLGSRRLALRPVVGRPGHWIALAAPEGDARPGLVQLEMARAAARVGAR